MITIIAFNEYPNALNFIGYYYLKKMYVGMRWHSLKIQKSSLVMLILYRFAYET